MFTGIYYCHILVFQASPAVGWVQSDEDTHKATAVGSLLTHSLSTPEENCVAALWQSAQEHSVSSISCTPGHLHPLH